MNASDHIEPAQEIEFPISIDQQLDLILPTIYDDSDEVEDFISEEFFKTRWLQLVDDPSQGVILHLFFEETQEYLYSHNGDILFKGKWNILKDQNALILERMVNNKVTQSELYDLAYMSEDFFILQKHGYQKQKYKSRYLVLGNEEVIKGMDKDTVLQILRKADNPSRLWIFLGIIGLIITLIYLGFKLMPWP